MFINQLLVASRKTKDRILGSLIAISVVALSCMPQLPKGIHIPHLDKMGHITLYALLMIYFGRKLPIGGVIIGLITIGIFMEGVQYMLGYRSAEVLDVVANIIGVLLGVVYIKVRGPVNG